MTEEEINGWINEWNEFIEAKNKRIRLLFRKKDFIQDNEVDDLISILEKDNSIKTEE